MKLYLVLLVSFLFQANFHYTQSFKKGTKVIYLGSAASSRYLDRNFFKETTEEYQKSPIVALGMDYCFSNISEVSNSRLGIGPYFSSWTAIHRYTDEAKNSWENHWTDFFGAIRFTHHLTYFVRNKLDMCSGIVLGVRYKHYHYILKEGASTDADYTRNKFYPAIGISASLRYYFYKNTGIFAEATFGYKTDRFLAGLCYKIN